MADSGRKPRDVFAHSTLLNEILRLIGARPDCRVWKNATGAAVSRTGSYVKFGKKGSADILGITSDGRMFCVEVKTGQAVQTKEQKAFQNMITKMGGRYFLARNSQSVVQFLDELNLAKVDFRHDSLGCKTDQQ